MGESVGYCMACKKPEHKGNTTKEGKCVENVVC